MRRLIGLDWEQPIAADSIAGQERIERDIVWEANRRHDAEHTQDPPFRRLRQ